MSSASDQSSAGGFVPSPHRTSELLVVPTFPFDNDGGGGAAVRFVAEIRARQVLGFLIIGCYQTLSVDHSSFHDSNMLTLGNVVERPAAPQ